MRPENDVILAVIKLSRAMKRCPPPPPPGPGMEDRPPCAPPPRHGRGPCAPAVGRLLSCVAGNPGVSSRDLCEILDLRPSSLSEMLSRAESEGWLLRTVDEEDRRIQRVDLSPRGRALVEEMESARKKETDRKTACFTEEEKAQFCALCNRLSDHLESLASDLPERPPRPPRTPLPPEGRMRC